MIAVEPRVRTVRSLSVERQIVHHGEAEIRIVKIPDYQVRLGPSSPWHRRGAIEHETACGKPYGDGHAMRAYVLDGSMCRDGCFSPHELRIGDLAEFAKEETTDVD